MQFHSQFYAEVRQIARYGFSDFFARNKLNDSNDKLAAEAYAEEVVFKQDDYGSKACKHVCRRRFFHVSVCGSQSVLHASFSAAVIFLLEKGENILDF